MDWFLDLFFGNSVAQSIVLLGITVGIGLLLGRVQVANVSLGITWILFVGIALGHFGLRLDPKVQAFAKDFGLILFVYALGLQVGPGFFSSFKKGGLKLNLLAVSLVLLGVLVTVGLFRLTGEPLTALVGVMSGAVTNTPGLGAAQQAGAHLPPEQVSLLASGYALAYPFGVLGIIFSLIALRYICRIDLDKERQRGEAAQAQAPTVAFAVRVTCAELHGMSIRDLHRRFPLPFVVPRVKQATGETLIGTGHTLIAVGDILNMVTLQPHVQPLTQAIGAPLEMPEEEWGNTERTLVSRQLVVSRPRAGGASIAQLHIRELFDVNVTRVYRAGMELVATPNLTLQLGDRITVVGCLESIQKLAHYLGNSLKRLSTPNLVPIFLGMALGVIVGSIPFFIPSIPHPLKLGLAGGPLIVAILMARFGPNLKVQVFTTSSANMMMREIGIALFLATVGLSAGETFIPTLLSSGPRWILYALAITVLPIMVVGLVARLVFKIDYFALMGFISGASTDPPALAFANTVAGSDAPAVAYATVYPLTMLLRVLAPQLLILLLV